MSGPPFALNARTRRAALRVLRSLKRSKRVLAASHVRADGDGLGSALAFARAAARLGVRVQVAAELGVVPEYRFMPGANRVAASAAELWRDLDAAFVFDCGSRERLGSIGRALAPSVPIVNVDHHASNTRFGAVNWVDPGFAATTEMVYVLAKLSRVRIDRAAAENLYTGLFTDTGGFSYSNTNRRSHLIAADLVRLGARPAGVAEQIRRRKTPGHLRLLARIIQGVRLSEDGRVAWARLTRAMAEEAGHEPHETSEYVDLLKSIAGVRVAVLFREVPEDGGIRISFRTSPPVDGSALAARFGGGGHKRASGATVEGGIEEVETRVIAEARSWAAKEERGDA